MRKTTLTFLMIATLLGCQKSPSQDAGQRSAAPLQKITVACTVQPQSTLVHVAVAKGYFVEEGLDVQLLMHSFGKVALESLVNKRG